MNAPIYLDDNATALVPVMHANHGVASGALAGWRSIRSGRTGPWGRPVGAMTTPDEVSRAANGLSEVWRKGGSL